MIWDRLLWGVHFITGKGARPLLIGTGWMHPRPEIQYNGQPTRPILFTTREQARAWCREERARYAHRNDCCADWRFVPVRVSVSGIGGRAWRRGKMVGGFQVERVEAL